MLQKQTALYMFGRGWHLAAAGMAKQINFDSNGVVQRTGDQRREHSVADAVGCGKVDRRPIRIIPSIKCTALEQRLRRHWRQPCSRRACSSAV